MVQTIGTVAKCCSGHAELKCCCMLTLSGKFRHADGIRSNNDEPVKVDTAYDTHCPLYFNVHRSNDTELSIDVVAVTLTAFGDDYYDRFHHHQFVVIISSSSSIDDILRLMVPSLCRQQ